MNFGDKIFMLQNMFKEGGELAVEKPVQGRVHYMAFKLWYHYFKL